MSNEATSPADELEQLRRHKERIELKAQIAALTTPWWRKASVVATVTAILAAVVPVKTAIEESYRNDRELALQQAKQQADFALQQAKQEHDIRMAYLDRFEVPGQRLQTLRFLIATTTDPRLLAWAREEQKIIQDQLAQIDKELAIVLRKIEQSPPGAALDELRKERDDLNRLKNVTTTRSSPAGGPK